PQTKLYLNGKASPSTSFRSQEVMKIFPSTPYRSYYRPTHQTNNITPRCGRAITKMERYAGRIQYQVLAKEIRERIHSSGFPCRDAGQSTTRYFTTSNNEAEYEALIVALRIVAQIGVRNMHVSVDSKLVANQVLGTYVAKEENMVKYLEKAKSLISGFANFSISQVPRSKNKKADALSKIASTSFAHLSKQVLVKVLKEKSIQEEEVATVVEEEGPTWMTPIMEYLKNGTLPDDRKEASKLRTRKAQVFDSHYGLFHEVDRGESRGDNHQQSGEEVHVGQDSMPLRSPRGNSFGQRPMDSWKEQTRAWVKESRPAWARETRIR
ncbi:reverse transcriptase domain-containing protein, partial [Tanacetum coccineum]